MGNLVKQNVFDDSHGRFLVEHQIARKGDHIGTVMTTPVACLGTIKRKCPSLVDAMDSKKDVSIFDHKVEPVLPCEFAHSDEFWCLCF
jgi:hypothetical protein